ncbi:hypothetical protein B0H11DRAFT_1132339 [Mycena galericulata]|nr:hypothetical protein B0H11DRAFT_1132339 [Mycena galericulata]
MQSTFVLMLAATTALAVPLAAPAASGVQKGRHFACQDPSRWPNGTVPLLVAHGQNITQNSCMSNATNSGILYDYQNGTLVVSNSTVTQAPDDTNATCSHVLDLEILSQVLEFAGGPCDQVQKSKNATALKQGYEQLVDMINNVTNLAYIDDQLVETKVDVVNKSMAIPVYHYQLNASDPNLFPRIDATFDLMNKTNNQSLTLAGELDKVIGANFPGTKTNVTSVYTHALEFAGNATKPQPSAVSSCSCACPVTSSTGLVSSLVSSAVLSSAVPTSAVATSAPPPVSAPASQLSASATLPSSSAISLSPPESSAPVSLALSKITESASNPASPSSVSAAAPSASSAPANSVSWAPSKTDESTSTASSSVPIVAPSVSSVASSVVSVSTQQSASGRVRPSDGASSSVVASESSVPPLPPVGVTHSASAFSVSASSASESSSSAVTSGSPSASAAQSSVTAPASNIAASSSIGALWPSANTSGVVPVSTAVASSESAELSSVPPTLSSVPDSTRSVPSLSTAVTSSSATVPLVSSVVASSLAASVIPSSEPAPPVSSAATPSKSAEPVPSSSGTSTPLARWSRFFKDRA